MDKWSIAGQRAPFRLLTEHLINTSKILTGYGHIAPKTHWGKVTTIFYAILGIPLMLLCLSNIGDIMASSFRYVPAIVEPIIGRYATVIN